MLLKYLKETSINVINPSDWTLGLVYFYQSLWLDNEFTISTLLPILLIGHYDWYTSTNPCNWYSSINRINPLWFDIATLRRTFVIGHWDWYTVGYTYTSTNPCDCALGLVHFYQSLWLGIGIGKFLPILVIGHWDWYTSQICKGLLAIIYKQTCGKCCKLVNLNFWKDVGYLFLSIQAMWKKNLGL